MYSRGTGLMAKTMGCICHRVRPRAGLRSGRPVDENALAPADTRWAAPTAAQRRWLAKGSSKGGGAGDKAAKATDAPAAAAPPKTIPVNVFKDGEDPVVLPDDQYPEWLWNLKLPTYPELARKDLKDLTMEEHRRLLQLDTRRKIKENNADTSF